MSMMALFKHFLRETSTTKPSSLLTVKEKEVVRDFVRKAKEKQGRGKYNEYTLFLWVWYRIISESHNLNL